ncbi:MAG TPA: potassium-transporting ATPase subunit C [Candidatus Acidoferrum sp.]|nr:potassium-transporting ATPase subunit C [Candidatus Acidoferrum sp.]
MRRYISKSLLLFLFVIPTVCIVYPLFLWVIGQVFFPFQANGSVIRDAQGNAIGSTLIAQPFTKDEYFQPRPSAASYDASASAPSNFSSSNYALRDRVARAIGPIVKYSDGPKKGEPAAPDVETWFQQDKFGGQPHIVAQWADAHNSLAQGWVSADPTHGAYVDEWTKKHPNEVAQWKKDNPATPEPKAADLAVPFFETFSKENPGKFPSAVAHVGADGKPVTTIEPVSTGSDVQSIFFDMWRQEHADAPLENLPADMVMASGSGLDPHISMDNAEYQLDRVSQKWAADTKRDPKQVHDEIEQILAQNSWAPFDGLVGEKFVNVLQVNLALREHYGEPK